MKSQKDWNILPQGKPKDEEVLHQHGNPTIIDCIQYGIGECSYYLRRGGLEED